MHACSLAGAQLVLSGLHSSGPQAKRTVLPTPANLTKTIPHKLTQPTGQPTVDRPSLRISSQVTLGFVKMTIKACHHIDKTARYGDTHLSLQCWGDGNRILELPSQLAHSEW